MRREKKLWKISYTKGPNRDGKDDNDEIFN